jgi:predicted negative regulator of RcsB-dependent stress response
MSTTQSTEGLNALEKLALIYEKKGKTINTIALVILLAVGGFFAYKYLVVTPNEEKASIAMMRAEQMFSIDSVNLALNGDPQNVGFLTIIKKYDGTSSANVAHFYAGSCYLKMGDFVNAIKQLKDFDAKGTVLEHARSGLLGDAYMETNDVKKAIEQFKAATADADDDVYTPIYLQRLAVAYEKNNQLEDAKNAYIRIRDEFPRSFQSRDVDKSLAMLGVLD